MIEMAWRGGKGLETLKAWKGPLLLVKFPILYPPLKPISGLEGRRELSLPWKLD